MDRRNINYNGNYLYKLKRNKNFKKLEFHNDTEELFNYFSNTELMAGLNQVVILCN